MHNNVAKPYDKFNLMKNIIFPMFHEHKEMYNYLFLLYFQKSKI